MYSTVTKKTKLLNILTLQHYTILHYPTPHYIQYKNTRERTRTKIKTTEKQIEHK